MIKELKTVIRKCWWLLIVPLLLLLGACVQADEGTAQEVVQSVGDGNVDGGLFWAVFAVIALVAIVVGVVSYYRSGTEDSEEAVLGSIVNGLFAFTGLLLAYFLLRWMADLYVDYLWYQDHGYPQVFWVTTGLPWALEVLSGVVAFLMMTFIGRRYFPFDKAVYVEPSERHWDKARAIAAEKERVRQINLRRFLLNLLPLFLSIGLGIYGATGWNEIALFFVQEPFGTADPIFGRDISYYVFMLPFFNAIRTWLAVFIACMGINGLVRWIFIENDDNSAWLSKLISFAGMLAFAVLPLLTWYFSQAKFGLLTDNNGSFWGASYADVQGGRIVLYNILTIMTGLAVIPVVYGIRKGKLLFVGLPLLVVLAARALVGNEGVLYPLIALLLTTGVGVWFLDFHNGERRLQLRTVVSVAAVTLVFTLFWSWPAIVQTIRVNPNELAYEIPYIRRHIDFTRAAYGLDKIEAIEFPYVDGFEGNQYAANSDVLEESRTFGWREVRQLSNQTQSRETYYEVLDTDLYYEDGQLWMTNPRELLPGQIANQNFINNHMRFLCGFGMVAAEPNEVTPQGHPVYVASQLPTIGDERFIPENERICYGEGTTSHVYVNTSETEIVPTSVEPTEYFGQRGVAVGTGIRRIAFALSFGSMRVLTSEAITAETRVLYHRQVTEMLERLTPFVVWDTDPFMVAGEDQYIWMNEGVITANGYPYSVQKNNLSGQDYRFFNYARPGITGIVHAYDGTIEIYAEDDPVISAWSKLLPGLLHPFETMTGQEVQNRRYPYDFFDMQAELYGLYHLTNEQAFYGKTRMWLPTTETQGQSGVTESEARYVVTRLPLISEEKEFILTLGFVQTTIENGELARKQNLGSILVARMGTEYGNLIAYEMPEELSIPSPIGMHSQVQDAITDQNLATLVTGTSQELYWSDFTLLPLMNDAGEGTLVGIQPLYKTSEGIPIVTRVFVVTGRGEVYHGGTLQEALEGLYRGSGGNVTLSPVNEEVQGDDGNSCEAYRLDAIAALEAQLPEEAARLTVEYWACSQ